MLKIKKKRTKNIIPFRHPIWTAWANMRKRCYDPSYTYYHRYGGRGITVCDRWLESVDNFFEDMGNKIEGQYLDRINVDGNYCKDNCRWTSAIQNAYNVSDRKSKYGRGVRKNGKSFTAQIAVDSKRYSIGTFKTIEEASKAYNNFCKEWYGHN